MCDLEVTELKELITTLSQKQENEHRSIDLALQAVELTNAKFTELAVDNAALHARVNELETSLSEIAVKANKGERAYWFSQPIGGARV